MARFKKLMQPKKEGKIVYGDGIVDGIVKLSVAELDNVELYSTGPKNKMRSSAIKVNFDKDGVHVEVSVKIYYLHSVTEMAFKIQEIIRHNVESMTEYHIASVNVVVKGVMFEEVSSNIEQLKIDINN